MFESLPSPQPVSIRWCIVFVASCVFLTASIPDAGAQPVQRVSTNMTNDEPAYEPTRVLVRFRRGAPRDFLPGSGAATGFRGDPDLYLSRIPPGLTVAETVRRYRVN